MENPIKRIRRWWASCPTIDETTLARATLLILAIEGLFVLIFGKSLLEWSRKAPPKQAVFWAVIFGAVLSFMASVPSILAIVCNLHNWKRKI